MTTRALWRTIALVGVLALGGMRVAYATSCPTHRNALAIWYLQWDQPYTRCFALAPYQDSFASMFSDYAGLGEAWSLAQYSLTTKTPAITLPFAQSQMLNQGVVLFDTHGGNAAPGQGAPTLEYHPSATAANAAGAAYIQAGTYTSSEILVSSGPTFDGLAVTNQGIQNKFRSNDPSGLILGHWSYSSYTQDTWSRAAFIGHAISPNCVESQGDYITLLQKLGCQIPGGNTVISSTPSSMSWAGDGGWALSCNVGCDNGVATFVRRGAFDDVGWTLVNHYNTKALKLVGYRSREDWPDHGTVLREIPPLAENGKHVYVAGGVGDRAFPLLAWMEEGRSGRVSWSDPFERTVRPGDWSFLMAFNDRGNEVTLTKASAAPPVLRILSHGVDSPVESSGPPIDIVVLGADPFLVADQVSALSAINSEWAIMYGTSSPTMTVSQQQWVMGIARSNNIAYNTACQQNPGSCPRLYPETPALCLVGDALADQIDFATFPDSYARCRPTCFDAGAGANVAPSTSPLEDGPVFLIPASTETDVTNLRASATRYENPSHPSKQHQRAIFILGDRVSGTVDPAPEVAAQNLATACISGGIPVYTLRESVYPPGVYGPRKTDFVAAVNAGASLIAGVGGFTDKISWPGSFTEGLTWGSELTREQSLVAILPNCDTAAEMDPLFGDASLIEDGMFASPTGTAIVFAVGHTNGGYDAQHELWMELLGLQIQDAPVGTPWPQIVFDAKYRAVAQYPFLLDYLRSVLSVGTMVRKQSPPTTTGLKNDDISGSPLALGLRVVGTGRTQPIFEFSLPRSDEVSLTVYDARGRIVATIYNQRTHAGHRRVTWNGRDQGGQLV